MAVTFDHDHPRYRAGHSFSTNGEFLLHDTHGDHRTAWYERYHNFRVMRRRGDAPKDSGTALLAALALGLFFWVAIFAVILSVTPAWR